MNFKIPKLDYKSIVIWSIMMLAGFKYLTMGIAHETLWFDESYSAAVISHSIPDIISIAAADSHPPLYFIMLKIFSTVFGHAEADLRLLSVLGVLALAALGIGPVRRIFGKFTGMVYMFIVIIVPISISIGQEARMYTWAAFFVTASALYGYLAAQEGKKTDWIKFGLTTLAAAFTHYFALLAVTIVNALIFAWLVAKLIIRKDKRSIISYLITASVVAVCYTPWIVILLKQAEKVSEYFWIPPVTNNVIWQALVFPFRAKFWVLETAAVCFVGAVILMVWGGVSAIVKRKEEGLMSLFAVLIYSFTLISAIVLSNAIRPLFVERYIFPVVGLFLLSLAYGISMLKNKAAAQFVCVVLLVISLPQISLVVTQRFNGPMKEVCDYVNKSITSGDVFVHTDEHTFGTFSYYYPGNKHYLYLSEAFKGYSGYEAFSPNGTFGSDINGFIKGKENIWLVNREGAPGTASSYSWFGNGTLRGKEEIHRFRIPSYSFYAISVRKVEPGNSKKAESSGKGDINLHLSSMDSRPGNYIIKLFNKGGPLFAEEGFNEKNVLMTKKVKTEGFSKDVVLEDLPFGSYAIFVFHDENENEKLDFKGNGMPKEGLGISNGFGDGEGPPSFEQGRFFLESDAIDMDIVLAYIP